MNDINSKADQLMDKGCKYLDSLDEFPSKPLFHYTSFKGLQGILESRRLWLTSHKYLNDPSEIYHGSKFIHDNINQRINSDLREFYNLITNNFIEKSYQTYLISFCENEDYLPAWRYYGHDGAGFSIGFKKKFFEISKNKKINFSFYACKINYENNEFEPINHVFDLAQKILPNWWNNNITIIRPFIISLYSNLLPLLPRVKNSDYHDEKEWRIFKSGIFIPETNSWEPQDFPFQDIFYDNIPIIPIPFVKCLHPTIPRIKPADALFEYSDIEKIYVGPRLDFTTAKPAIESELRKHITEEELKNISIIPSTKPYR